MLDFDILDHFGSNELMLRAIFQAPGAEGEKLVGDAKTAYKAALKRHRESKGGELSPQEETKFQLRFEQRLRDARANWEPRIHSRIEEGRLRNFQNYRWHYAADLAWDGPAFKEQIPLMLYAQGKIDIQQAAEKLNKTVGEDKAKDYIERDEDGGIQSINVTRLGENVINLVRPNVTRRKAALDNKYRDLYPWLKYEPRAKTMGDKIRAEVATQRGEMITDQQGWRHESAQWIHKMLLYAEEWVFVANPWMKEKAYRKVGDTIESYTTKEGPRLVAPHPTRVFYDFAHPAATINADNGVTYCGYWDVHRYRDIKGNPSYFNRDQIRYSSTLDHSFNNYRDYFDAYFAAEGENAKRLKFCPTSNDPLNSMKRDRKAQIESGVLGKEDGDCCIYFTHYYERVIPKDVGLGHYPYPIWVKLTVANDKTVVRARIMPSRPAFYMGHNVDDTRTVNVSMAHEIMPYQDQVQSLLSQMYYLMRIEQLVLVAIDTDVIPDTDMRGAIKDYLKGQKTRAEAMYFEWSQSKIQELYKQNSRDPIKVITAHIQSQIATCMTGIEKTLKLHDRNLMMSPQELGQFVERETSATENMIVEKTTNALHNFTSSGVDEGRAALKVILYESMMACGDDEVVTPVTASFPRAAVEAIGFQFYEDGAEGAEEPGSQRRRESVAVLAKKEHMAFEYIYNSRDGAERTVSVEAAKTLQQFVDRILSNDRVLQMFGGWEQIIEMVSEVFRLSGSPFFIQLPEELPEWNPAAMPEQMQQLVDGFRQELQTIAGQLNEQSQDALETAEQSESVAVETQQQVAALTQSLNTVLEGLGAAPIQQ